MSFVAAVGLGHIGLQPVVELGQLDRAINFEVAATTVAKRRNGSGDLDNKNLRSTATGLLGTVEVTRVLPKK